MNARGRRFELLTRAWRPVFEWYKTSDPRCPCKSLVGPALQDWVNFKASWSDEDPDDLGLDEQTSSLRDAVATIQRYAGRKLVVGLPDPMSGETICAAVVRDPTDDGAQFEGLWLAATTGKPGGMLRFLADQAELRAELPALRSMDRRLGATGDAVATSLPDAQAQAAALIAQATGAVAGAAAPPLAQALSSAAQPAIDQAVDRAVDRAADRAQRRSLVPIVVGVGLLGAIGAVTIAVLATKRRR